mmetsp:Transcript_61967/g.135721  ORF Transcript_61967/g.135721 Transcript_61967/m.135721 type:complete len:212 (-) Transcript_61967:484-1119(-)
MVRHHSDLCVLDTKDCTFHTELQLIIPHPQRHQAGGITQNDVVRHVGADFDNFHIEVDTLLLWREACHRVPGGFGQLPPGVAPDDAPGGLHLRPLTTVFQLPRATIAAEDDHIVTVLVRHQDPISRWMDGKIPRMLSSCVSEAFQFQQAIFGDAETDQAVVATVRAVQEAPIWRHLEIRRGIGLRRPVGARGRIAVGVLGVLMVMVVVTFW